MMDVMHIRVDIVYDKYSGTYSQYICFNLRAGAIKGLMDLGEIYSHLSSFEQSLTQAHWKFNVGNTCPRIIYLASISLCPIPMPKPERLAAHNAEKYQSIY